MSSVVQILPSSLAGVPYLTDRAIVGATDISSKNTIHFTRKFLTRIIQDLYYNAGQVKDITNDVKYRVDPDGLGVYKLETHLSKDVGEGTIHEYGAGPLTFKVQLTENDRLSLQTFYSPPLFANVLMNSSYGTLDKGITATIGPSDILDGTVAIDEGEDKKPHLKYDIILTLGQKRYRGDITLDLNYSN